MTATASTTFAGARASSTAAPTRVGAQHITKTEPPLSLAYSGVTGLLLSGPLANANMTSAAVPAYHCISSSAQ